MNMSISIETTKSRELLIRIKFTNLIKMMLQTIIFGKYHKILNINSC